MLASDLDSSSRGGGDHVGGILGALVALLLVFLIMLFRQQRKSRREDRPKAVRQESGIAHAQHDILQTSSSTVAAAFAIGDELRASGRNSQCDTLEFNCATLEFTAVTSTVAAALAIGYDLDTSGRASQADTSVERVSENDEAIEDMSAEARALSFTSVSPTVAAGLVDSNTLRASGSASQVNTPADRVSAYDEAIAIVSSEARAFSLERRTIAQAAVQATRTLSFTKRAKVQDGRPQCGLKWIKVGTIPPITGPSGRELINEKLSLALQHTNIFHPKDLAEFDLHDINSNDYVLAGRFYYQPYDAHRSSLKSKRPLGWKWINVGNTAPCKGSELTNAKLSFALRHATSFTTEDIALFDLPNDLQPTDFVLSGSAYFQPYVAWKQDSLV